MLSFKCYFSSKHALGRTQVSFSVQDEFCFSTEKTDQFPYPLSTLEW